MPSLSDDYRPIIGILTQPNVKQSLDHYILEVNDNLNNWSGLRTIAIPYDISEKKLNVLLRNINGVHLTGGSLELIDQNGKQHPYYVTAKRILEYSKYMKKTFNADWPVLAIC